MITAGYYHSLGIKTNGTLWAWGYNANGRLGINNTTSKTTPTQVYGSNFDWSIVVAGGSHTVAIKTNGTLWSWGLNTNGQLGVNSTAQKLIPTREFTSASDWLAIEAGNSHTIVLKTNGTLWAWGLNDNGQLGINDTTQRTTPTQEFTSASDWSIINAGYKYSLGIKTNGTLWAWGDNSAGQLGLGDTEARLTPSQIGIDSDWTKITGGISHTLSLKTNSTLWAWGLNDTGQLGLNDTINRNVPTLIGE
jgi:alpha-tubulin suppressor-like RCC1 family protein